MKQELNLITLLLPRSGHSIKWDTPTTKRIRKYGSTYRAVHPILMVLFRLDGTVGIRVHHRNRADVFVEFDSISGFCDFVTSQSELFALNAVFSYTYVHL